MEIYNNFNKYKQHIPEYNKWAQEQDLLQAQREEYLKQNPDKINEHDIRRGQIVLHAIDIMDEYSQNNAEDTEVATEMAQAQVCSLAQLGATALGTATLAIPAVKKSLQKLAMKTPILGAATMFIPTIIGYIAGTIASFPAIMWGTKMQINASRAGRFEAMRKDLKNPAVFALLTKEQLNKANELSKDIILEDETKKRLKNASMNPLNSFKTLKKMFDGRNEYKLQKAEFVKTLNEKEKQFEKTLSQEQIRNAKRDQQLMAKLVNKLDIASQDYAENVELATNTITTIALAGGALTGWITNKILKSLKLSGAMSNKIIPWAVGAILPLGMGIYSAQIQKQASRIGRFKAKQEFLNNPNSFVYVEDSDAAKLTEVKLQAKDKKPNIFKFLVQVTKDNKEFKNYKKTTMEQNLKFQKALEKIDLTDEQIQEAKNLQLNVFKTFNKVDEKSQTYSESVEAMGEFAKQGIGFITGLAVTAVSFIEIMKMLSGKTPLNNFFSKYISKIGLGCVVPLLAIIGLDVYITKQQKKASRVADMLALKDLGDYRHYADFSDLAAKPDTKIEKTKSSTNLLSRYKS